MRTKLFLAFLTVILTALVSNLIFARLSERDFDDYSMGMREDKLYWMLASVEGSHDAGSWDTMALTSVLQWGSMMGFDARVMDSGGTQVMDSAEALAQITPTMRRRIEGLVFLDSASGEFEQYPLFASGNEIGTLMVRKLDTRGSYNVKESVFKKRGRRFLLISFVIAGGGALFLAVALSLFLTGPLRRLRLASERVASGDLGARVDYTHHDEVGSLISSFNHMVESLEREDALRQRLTQNVAHELRTPLTVMRSHLEAISDGVVECGPEAMATLAGEVSRLTNLVRGIEDLTRAEASFFRPAEPETVSMRGFVEEAVSGMRALALEREVSLEVDVPESLEAETDTEKLGIALKNILSNAINHTGKGAVRISAGQTGDGGVAIEVEDTGPGIEPGQMEVIFKRFYKGEGSAGVGLGLAIAKELVEAMGGTLEARSAPGTGSTFRIVLPPSADSRT